MSAKKGLTRSFRLIGCLAAVALLVSALFASAASAKKAPPTEKTAYIAMGDSLSFGYSEEKFDLNFPAEPISAYEGGFVNQFAAKLAKIEGRSGKLLETFNLACPGETSKGLIGNGPLGEALIAGSKISEGEAPCSWHNVNGFARHYEYGGASQLEAALGIIATKIPVSAVTMQIGSNDELHKLGECKSETYYKAHGFSGFIECVEGEAEKTLFPTIINNIGVTIGVLREAGYTGKIVLLGFYNPQAFLLPGSDLLQSKLNEAIEGELALDPKFPSTNVKYANPFKKTNPVKKGSTAEHEAICKYTEECNEFDKHQNLIKFLQEKGLSKAEAEAAATEKATKEFPEGDIHPTPEGHKLFAGDLWKAFRH
jgi:lysophospholipase L1-like esterase